MNVKKYVESVLKTKSPHYSPENVHPDLVHAVLGLVTESAELADIIKRAYFYGKGPESVDKDHIVEEFSDICYYLALGLNIMGTSFEEVMDMNISKLKKRYPDGFSTDKAFNRNLELEKEVFKK